MSFQTPFLLGQGPIWAGQEKNIYLLHKAWFDQSLTVDLPLLG